MNNNETHKLEEAQVLITLVGFAREDVGNGNTMTSSVFKDRLRERGEAAKGCLKATFGTPYNKRHTLEKPTPEIEIDGIRIIAEGY